MFTLFLLKWSYAIYSFFWKLLKRPTQLKSSVLGQISAIEDSAERNF